MASLQWLDRPVLRDPVALMAFEGWGDAGESASQAVASFIEHSDAEIIAVIDPDDHFDFPVRRPMVQLDSEGVFRAVISHTDPGVPNWLDTAGHTQGIRSLRPTVPKPRAPRSRSPSGRR